jgi:hypothetical protein
MSKTEEDPSSDQTSVIIVIFGTADSRWWQKKQNFLTNLEGIAVCHGFILSQIYIYHCLFYSIMKLCNTFYNQPKIWKNEFMVYGYLTKTSDVNLCPTGPHLVLLPKCCGVTRESTTNLQLSFLGTVGQIFLPWDETEWATVQVSSLFWLISDHCSRAQWLSSPLSNIYFILLHENDSKWISCIIWL